MSLGVARLFDRVDGWCNHGNICCTHLVVGKCGTISGGSPNVFTNNLNTIRLNEVGRHASCCNINQFWNVQGNPTVLVNDRPIVRLTDVTRHCGGWGKVTMASTNVFA